MAAKKELVAMLADRLAGCGYGEFVDGETTDLAFAAAAAETKGRSRKFVCAVVEVPAGVRDVAAAGRALADVRRALAKRHAGFPWLTRLGTFLVVLCRRGLWERLRGRDGLIDTTSLHVNVLLGSVLVDADAYQTSSDHNLGLLDAGDQFRYIQGAVEDWCRARRRELRLDRTVGQVLSVA